MAEPAWHVGDYPRLEFWTGINLTALAAPVAAGASAIRVYDTGGYADGDVVAIEAGLDRGEVRTIASGGVNATAGTLTFTAALARPHPAAGEVMELAAPSTLVVTIIAPSGAVTTLGLGDLTPVMAGHYRYEGKELDEEGRWRVTQVATGAVKAGGRDLVLSVVETERV